MLVDVRSSVCRDEMPAWKALDARVREARRPIRWPSRERLISPEGTLPGNRPFDSASRFGARSTSWRRTAPRALARGVSAGAGPRRDDQRHRNAPSKPWALFDADGSARIGFLRSPARRWRDVYLHRESVPVLGRAAAARLPAADDFWAAPPAAVDLHPRLGRPGFPIDHAPWRRDPILSSTRQGDQEAGILGHNRRQVFKCAQRLSPRVQLVQHRHRRDKAIAAIKRVLLVDTRSKTSVIDLYVSSTTSMSHTREDPRCLTERIIGCAIEVHRALGPGLLESVYRECLALEPNDRHLLRDRTTSLGDIQGAVGSSPS